MGSRMHRDQRGFTLIELLAVMAIIGILAAIVVPAVSGSKEAGKDAEVKEGAFTVQSVSGDFFAAQKGAEVITPLTVNIDADINGNTDRAATTTQKISSRWPERYLTDTATSTGAYAVEFRTSTTTTGSRVRAVNITDLEDGGITRGELLANYTAIDFGILTGETASSTDPRSDDFLAKEPKGVTTLSGDKYRNYLWLLLKGSSKDNQNDSRKVVVFKLINVEEDEGASPDVVLTYRQIF